MLLIYPLQGNFTKLDPVEPKDTGMSISEALSFLGAQISTSADVQPKKVIISRLNVLESAFIDFSRKYFKPSQKLLIQFISETKLDDNSPATTYIEEALDVGGPRWEFFTLAVKEIHRSLLYLKLVVMSTA